MAGSGLTRWPDTINRTMQGDLDRILISRDRIAERIESLAADISRELAAVADGSSTEEIVLVPVLTGSIIFVADLIRHLPLKVRMHVVTVSSYPGKAMTSQGAQIVGDLPGDITGKHVLIVDDILDSGTTLRLLRESIEARNPASVRACVLLRKTIPSAADTQCEYVGFDIPNEFVVGYGLDYNGYYRNLPDIGVLKQEAVV